MLVIGKLGVGIPRGQTLRTPVAAAVTDGRGATRAEPVRRNTRPKGQAMGAVVADHKVPARVPPEALLKLASD